MKTVPANKSKSPGSDNSPGFLQVVQSHEIRENEAVALLQLHTVPSHYIFRLLHFSLNNETPIFILPLLKHSTSTYRIYFRDTTEGRAAIPIDTSLFLSPTITQ